MLVCGLNIRSQNRISLNEQRQALGAIRQELDAVPVEDKGSYLVTTQHEPGRTVDLVLGALRHRRPDLKVPGAAVAAPTAIEDALAELSKVLLGRYGHAFDASDSSVNIGESLWRGGFARAQEAGGHGRRDRGA